MAEKTKKNPSPSRKRQAPPAGDTSVIVYAAQCGECFKWRVIPTQEEFEDMRSRFIEDPFFCNKIADVCCDDPADIEYDDTRIWVIDKPNLPKTPAGFQRQLVLRRDFSKMDAYYVTPAGTRMRSSTQVAPFLEANPQCEGLSVSDFAFAVPKVMEDTIPGKFGKGLSSANKKIKALTEGDDDV
ncbi:hypothetical protein C3L33_07531, partial [Rhododendron williamsianum]